MTECPRCLFTSDIAVIGEHQCNYCDLHDELEARANPADLNKVLAKIRNPKKKYDCIIGISGGLDSSTLLYAAVSKWGLNPLVIHYDNGWNSIAAKNNMKNLIEKLRVDCITYNINAYEVNSLNAAFLYAGVPDADIPNDIAMTKLMYDTADKYGIKWILNGHDFRTEGSTPAKWTYMDAKYIRSVFKNWIPLDSAPHNFPLFTFKDQIIYGLKGIKQVRPFHYITDRTGLESEMKKLIGWSDYGGKHAENIYTEFVGSYLLPLKFGIDKRRVYLSARVRSGMIVKAHAEVILDELPYFDLEKLGESKSVIVSLSKSKIRPRSDFERYNFKRYRVIIWMLTKLKIVPYTFYKKYCF